MANNYKFSRDNAMRDFVLELNPNDPDKLFSIIIKESERVSGSGTTYTNKLMAGDMTLEQAMEEYLA